MQGTCEAIRVADCSLPNRQFHILYVFAGLPRQADIRERLTALQQKFQFKLFMIEFDLLRDASHDVNNPNTWKQLCHQLETGVFDVLIITPPCNTHSRARHSWRRSPGPRPLRNVHWPYGFPWLENDALTEGNYIHSSQFTTRHVFDTLHST